MAKDSKVGRLYDWLPYGALLCLLVLVYIANVHRVQKKIRAINEEYKQIEELKREYFSIKQKSLYDGTLNQVAKKIEGFDLEREVPVPKKIEKVKKVDA